MIVPACPPQKAPRGAGANLKHCTYCGKENRHEAQFSGHCGRAFWVDTPRQVAPTRSYVGQAPNPRTATFLSFLWPGLGQIYNGQIVRGVVFGLIQLFLWTWPLLVEAAILATKTNEQIFREALHKHDQPLGFLGFFIGFLGFFIGMILDLGPPTAFWIYSMIDAKREAERTAGMQE